MVGSMCRGEAGMAVRRVGCCDCILRDRCRWLLGGVAIGSCVGTCDLGWALVIGLWDWSTLLGAEAVNLRFGWWVGSHGWRVVVFGSVCEPLGVG
jgi:hypothetical protein